MWGVVVLFAILSIVLLSGKGAFLIAGYNTASEQEKAQYDEKKLCRVMGICMLLITAILAVYAAYGYDVPKYLSWLMPWGLFAVVISCLVASNTLCKNKNSSKAISESAKKSNKLSLIISIVFLVVIGVFVSIMLFTGSVEVNLDKNEIRVGASMSSDRLIKYDDIKSVSYTEKLSLGSRTNGIGSMKLQAGDFKNQEFGNYNLYSYTDCKEYIIIKTNDDKIIVINDTDKEKTKTLFFNILEKVK